MIGGKRAGWITVKMVSFRYHYGHAKFRLIYEEIIHKLKIHFDRFILIGKRTMHIDIPHTQYIVNQ